MNARRSIIPMSLVFLIIVVFGCNSSDDPIDVIEDCSINITQPVVGYSSWSTGDFLILRWEKAGVAEFVKINLMRNGALVNSIIESTPNDGYYRWTVSTFGESNGDYTILIEVLGEDSCSDEVGPLPLTNTAGCNFEFTGIIDALPDTVFVRDSILDIEWVGTNTSGSVKLELVDPLGVSAIITESTSDDGYYGWPVTSFHNDSYDSFKLKISDPQVDGCSAESGNFRIFDDEICQVLVTAPGSHEVLTEGTDFVIRFTMDDMDGNVDLWLCAGYERIGSIGTNVDTISDSFTWNVNDFAYIGTHQMFRVHVVARNDSYCSGYSEEFTILER